MTSLASPASKLFKISFKLPATIILASTIAALSAGFFGYYQIDANLNNAVNKRVEIILQNQKNRLTSYLNEIENDLHQKATSLSVSNAIVTFNNAWQTLGKQPTDKLQKAYITDNQHKLGEKEKLDFAPAANDYNKAHKQYHPPMRDFLYTRGYYDIFLFNLNGDLIYTVFKELDYATNLQSGKYKDTGLGTVFQKALTLNTGERVFDDFKPYSPSHGAAASFIAEPVFSAAGKRLGVIAFQMPIDNINQIMKSNGQLGSTGETFIIGDDGLMRSDSEINDTFKILETKISAPIIEQSTDQAVLISHNEIYNGADAIMAVTDLKFFDTVWTLVAAQQYQEAFAPLIHARNLLFLLVMAVLSLILFVGYLVSRSITTPISKLTNIMSLISQGKLETKIIGAARKDEIGAMANAVLVFKDNALANISMEQQQITDRKNMEQQNKLKQQQFANSFKDNVLGLIENVGESCIHMGNNAKNLMADSVQSIEQSNTAKTASERASMNVQNVAAASEQLSSSITEISRQVNESRLIVSDAMQGAETTNTKVEQLSVAANGIGEVISLIQSIAEQTNLLALNATIEAARAGDAGKGFAVVATEVKALAAQTARATEEISNHISSIQQSTGETVVAIGEITTTLAKVNDITTVIAAAVEEQGSATSLISQNIQEASNETSLASENMVVVTNGADKANQNANEMNNATEIMTVQTQELETQVNEFIGKILVA